MHPAEAVGWNEMPFGKDTRVVPCNIVLDRGSGLPTGSGDLGWEPQSKFALQIAAKPLQIAECLLQTAYRNSAMPYSTVPSLTPYDFPFLPNDMYAAMLLVLIDFFRCYY